jgi:carboxypeptidase PM20D1
LLYFAPVPLNKSRWKLGIRQTTAVGIVKIFTVLLISLVGLLFCVLLVNTFLSRSQQLEVVPVTMTDVHVEAAITRLAQAVRFRTISHQGGEAFDHLPFQQLHVFLNRAFPAVHARLKKEIVGEFSLLFTWPGRDPSLKPILLMAHLDVVPVEADTEKDWVVPPFAGQLKDGYLWGRGSMDDKASVLAILEAVEFLLAQGFQPERTVYLAFGHDEEISGHHGAAQIAALLAQRDIRLASVLDEGLLVTHGIVPGMPQPVALIGVAEKGYASIDLTVRGAGGHSSMPPPQTAIGILSRAVDKLERHQMPTRLDGSAKQMLEYLGPEMGFLPRLVMANLWLFAPLVEHRFAAAPTTNAVIRTTTAVTMFESGVKENVLPTRARAVVNFRILPGDTVEDVLAHVQRTVNDSRVSISLLHASHSEASRQSSSESLAFQHLHRAIRQVFPDVVVAPSLVIPTTDSRYFASLAQDVYRFLPIRVARADLNRIHGSNERISTENYTECIRFYLQYMRNAATE